jgi:predicted transcriptional regulator
MEDQEQLEGSRKNHEELEEFFLDDDKQGRFEIEQLFGSRTRARLLGLFLENAERSFFVREIARRVDAQLNAVRRELKNLLDVGIIFESDASEGEKGEKKKFYQANSTFPLFEDLRNVMRKVGILMNKSLVEGLQGKGDLELVLLTGRFVDAPTIPTDVVIVSTCAPEVITAAIADFERDLGREVNYTALSPTEYRYRKDVGDRFLQTIFSAKHAVLFDASLV